MTSFKIIGLGEILWDCLPAGNQLGGAPANFAYISNQLGNEGIILSRVGQDQFGRDMLEALKAKNLSTAFLQLDENYRTGQVKVTLENGQPNYEIVENVAWDFLELNKAWQKLAKTCDAVCFGTLAQRNPISKKTIQAFVNLTKGLRIFDVNLRQKYFSRELLQESLTLADVVKLNHEELRQVVAIFGIEGITEIEQAQNLRERFDLQMVSVTCGGAGSWLIAEHEISAHAGVVVEVADSIGAGDAFTATMAHGILQKWNLDKINQKANEIGAFVASRTGAMPNFPKEFKS